MLAYIPRHLLPLNILFFVTFLLGTSLIAMDWKDGDSNDLQGIHIKVNGLDLIKKLEEKCKVFNTNEMSSTYHTSEKVIKFLDQEPESSERAPLFNEIMGYLEELLSENNASFFENSWLAITSAITGEMENQPTTDLLTQLREEMWQALEVIKYSKTLEKEYVAYEREKATAMALPMDVINSLLPSKKNGNSSCSKCCQPGGYCAGGFKAWLKSIVLCLCPWC